VTVPAAHEEDATAVLWEHGTLGIEVLTAGGLLAYFPEAPGLLATLAAALAPLSGARIQPVDVPDVDWVARYREGFRSFSVAGFRVAPPWALPAGDAADESLLVVDPGRAFGTGTHESTRLCLGFLRDLAGRGPLGRVLDLGTGSGILSVAAARLGARAVTAVDLDPEALLAARHQARLNRADLRLVRGDLAAALRPSSFDVVLANIAVTVLVDRCDEIAALGAPSVVLSGLLTSDLDAVRRSYAGLGSLDVRTDGEWGAVLLQAQAEQRSQRPSP
jgi:ribosomal protein L11 methyltransferase